MNLNLEIISPVNIGNGEILSPLCDYISERKTFFLIDHRKLEAYLKHLDEPEKIVDRYVHILNGKTHYNLSDFFKENGLDPVDFSLAVINDVNRINGEIKRTIKTGRGPYIPGSTLKGAIRTAIICHHMNQEGYDFNKIMKEKRYIGQDYFGAYGNDVFKFLHCSDSLPFNESDVDVVNTYLYYLNTRKTNTPVSVESIKKKAETEVKIQSKAKRGDQLSSKFNYFLEGGEEEILMTTNGFYSDLLENEKRILQEKNPVLLTYLNGLFEELQKLATHFNDNGNGAILKVGSGKTFYDNTIAAVLSEDDFSQLKHKYHLGNTTFFPKTRTVVYRGNHPASVMGWIKLEKVKN